MHGQSVSELVPLGSISPHQGCHQAAHAAGSVRGHSRLYPHQRWKLQDVNVLGTLAYAAGAFRGKLSLKANKFAE